MKLSVHGDDFLITGSRANLQWARKQFEGEYDCKVDVIGLDDDLPKSTRFLNRAITYGPDSLEFEADQRLIEAIVTGLKIEGGNTCPYPGSKNRPITKAEQQAMMERRLTEVEGGNCTVSNLKAQIGKLMKS